MEKRRKYVSPLVETAQMEACEMMAGSVKSIDLGIGSGGNAFDHGITDADANRNSGWDLW